MAKKRFIKTGAALLLVFFFGSCIGVSADITIRKNGSGFITLEYRVSGELEALGKLDGNARWLPVPVGRADFERTVARIPSMRMASFSTKRQGGDVVSKARLNFGDTGALLKFLDALGAGAGLVSGDGGKLLALDFGSGEGAADPLLAEFAAEAAAPYSLELRFDTGAEADIFLVDRDGRRYETASLPRGWTLGGGRKAVFSAPMGDVLTAAEPVRLRIRWAD